VEIVELGLCSFNMVAGVGVVVVIVWCYCVDLGLYGFDVVTGVGVVVVRCVVLLCGFGFVWV
jgi:hypothetical protein